MLALHVVLGAKEASEDASDVSIYLVQDEWAPATLAWPNRPAPGALVFTAPAVSGTLIETMLKHANV